MSKFIPNSFQVPNVVIDELMADLTGAELKCYLFVLRKTKGWNKEFDAISIAQFMEFCNLSNRAVIDACNRLVELGLLEQKTGSRGVKVFSVKNYSCEESSPVKKVHSTCEESSQVPVKKVHTQNNNLNNTTKNTPLTPQGEPAHAEEQAVGFVQTFANDSDERKTEQADSAKPKNLPVDYQGVMEEFNQAVEHTPIAQIRVLSDNRKRAVHSLAKLLRKQFGCYTRQAFGDYFRDFVAQASKRSDQFYFGGPSGSGWKADFDYLLKPKTFAKTVEESL